MSTPERNPEPPDPARPSRESMRETLQDDSSAGEWALAYRMLRNAGAAPPWIESDKAVRSLLEERDRLVAGAGRRSAHGHARAREELARVVEAANGAIARVNAEAPTDRQHRRSLDLAAELERLERAARGETSEGA